MLHVTLYQYTNKPIIVDKSSYLTGGVSVTGNAVSANQDMERPIVILHFNSEPDYNYFYIQEYHRYYYLLNKTWVSGDVWQIEMVVDELYTYKTLVNNISGIVAYSNKGSAYKRDPRLVYNEPLKRTIYTPLTPTHPSSPTSPGNAWVLLRYYAMDINTTLLPGSPWHINCVYMSFRAYNYFLSNYLDYLYDHSADYEKYAVALGSCIIDVSVVYYIDPETTDASPFPNVASNLDIVFNAPAVLKANNNMPITIKAGLDDDPNLNCYAYHINPYTQNLTGRQFNFTRSSLYDWNRMSDFVIYLPFVGKVSINPEKFGLDDDMTYTIGVKVAHEPGENVYVVTALFNNTIIRETRTTFNVCTTVAFPVDASFENSRGAIQNALWSLAGNSIGMVAKGVVSSPVAAVSDAGRMVGSISSTLLQLENLKMRDAMSQQFIGSVGGSPDFIEPNNINIYGVGTVLEPAGDYAFFWGDHGMPDGAYRDLSDLTGYVQMQEFEMIYSANATKGEMDRLEAQLYEGVIL